MNPLFIINLFVLGLLYWLSVYIITRNIRSKIAWVSAIMLGALVIYALGETISKYITDYSNYQLLWGWAQWSYILPIALVFHFSVMCTKSENEILNKYYLAFVYFFTAILIFIQQKSNLIISYEIGGLIPGIGYYNPRGSLFWLIAVFVFIVCLGASRNYIRALKPDVNNIKYLLALLTSVLYLIIGPFVVYLFYSNYANAVQWSPLLFLLAFTPILIAILRYRLISDVDYIFNWSEFIYLTLTIIVINIVSGSAFTYFIAPKLGELSYIFVSFFTLTTITTHGFYDWLATFIRDLVYNTGKGFSLITDADVNDLVRNYHNPEKLEANTILKFRIVKRRANDNKLIDASQNLICESINYFKQSDYPRRTKQNLKYQILKMITLDESEEGQILWELGFEGYPMKIMHGESHTRNPLFKTESMSDYTATSRNAFISLKKEAIHDLGLRLSYLERAEK